MTDPYLFDWNDPPPREARRRSLSRWIERAYIALLIALAIAVSLAALLGPWLAGSAHGEGGDVERWRPLVSQYDDWNADLALLVVSCESEGRPGATNPVTGAAGLFQLYGWEWKARELYGPGASVYDPAVNVGTAHWIWKAGGGRFGSRIGWQASQGCWS